MVAYASLEQLKSVLNYEGDDKDALFTAWLEGASRLIDGYCKRRFDQVTETRRYIVSERSQRVYVDDLVSVTAVSYGGDELAIDEVIELWPYGSAPYAALSLVPGNGVRAALPARARVEVSGTFGWPDVPADIEMVCLRMAGALHRQAEAGFGEAIAQGDIGTVIVTRVMDSLMKLTLQPYRKLVLA